MRLFARKSNRLIDLFRVVHMRLTPIPQNHQAVRLARHEWVLSHRFQHAALGIAQTDYRRGGLDVNQYP